DRQPYTKIPADLPLRVLPIVAADLERQGKAFTIHCSADRRQRHSNDISYKLVADRILAGWPVCTAWRPCFFYTCKKRKDQLPARGELSACHPVIVGSAQAARRGSGNHAGRTSDQVPDAFITAGY